MGGFLGDGSPPSRIVEGKYAPTLSSRACVQMDCRNASKTRQVVVPTQAMTGWVAALSSLVCRGLAATRRRKQDRLQYQPTLMVFDGEGCCRVLRGFLWRSAGCFAAFVGEASAPSRVVEAYSYAFCPVFLYCAQLLILQVASNAQCVALRWRWSAAVSCQGVLRGTFSFGVMAQV